MNILLDEMMKTTFKRKLYGLKGTFRFLSPDEVIDKADHQFAVAGFGTFCFKTAEQLEEHLSYHAEEILHGSNWESKVYRWLVENSHEFEIGHRMLLIARMLDHPNAQALWPTQVPGEKVSEYPNRVFIRKV